jgi:hypothetical protein
MPIGFAYFATMVMLKNTSAQTTENLNALGNPKDADKKEDLVVTEHKVESNENCVEKLRTTDLTSTQDISAGNIDPTKLITFLRVRFGIGRFEITLRPLPRQHRRHIITHSMHRGYLTFTKFGHQDFFPQSMWMALEIFPVLKLFIHSLDSLAMKDCIFPYEPRSILLLLLCFCISR